jgi:uncharacterized protein
MDIEKSEVQRVLPFNNLFLNSGVVHGRNNWQLYLLTIVFTMLAYSLAPVISFIHLIVLALGKGFTRLELESDPAILLQAVKLGIDRNYVMIAVFGIFLIAAAVFSLCLRKLHRKSITSVLTGYEKFRTRRFFFAFTVWGALIVVSFLIDYFANPGSYQFALSGEEGEALNTKAGTVTTMQGGVSAAKVGGLLISILIMVICIPVQAGFEESFFRGYALQGLAQIFKNGLYPLLITSILFSMVHMDNPEVKKYGVAIMFLYYASFGLFLGALSLLDEGLELAFGIHAANNFVSSIIISSEDSALKTYSLFSTGEGDALTEYLVWIVCAAIAFFIFRKKYRWNNFSLLVR